MLFIVATTRQWIVSICTLIFWLMSEYQRESGYVVLLEWYWSICRKVTWIYPRNFFIIIMQIFPRCIVVFFLIIALYCRWMTSSLALYLFAPAHTVFSFDFEGNKRDSHEILSFWIELKCAKLLATNSEDFPRNHSDSSELFLNFPRNAIEVNISTLGCRWMTIGLSC